MACVCLAFQTAEHDDGVQIIPKLEYCRSNHLNIFVGCIYAYKGLLMVRSSPFSDF